MLVPELLKIAEQLKVKVPASKKNDKQDLIYKILDKQAVDESEDKKTEEKKKPGRKRTIKATTGNTTEDAEVMSDEPEEEAQPRKRARKTIKKAPVAKAEKREDADHQEKVGVKLESKKRNKNTCRKTCGTQKDRKRSPGCAGCQN